VRSFSPDRPFCPVWQFVNERTRNSVVTSTRREPETGKPEGEERKARRLWHPPK
jgi:hypothetical protein